MKILLSCLWGTALLASHLSSATSVVSILQKIDSCLEIAEKALRNYQLPGKEYKRHRLTPVHAESRMQTNCSAEDLHIIQEHFKCLADAICDWALPVDAIIAAGAPDDFPDMRECPRTELKPSLQCGSVFAR